MGDHTHDHEVLKLEAVRQRLALLRRRIKEIKQGFPEYLLDSDRDEANQDAELTPASTEKSTSR
jgi:hypothetical protein